MKDEPIAVFIRRMRSRHYDGGSRMVLCGADYSRLVWLARGVVVVERPNEVVHMSFVVHMDLIHSAEARIPELVAGALTA